MSKRSQPWALSRRQAIASVGAAMSASSLAASAAHGTETAWDHEADVLCVGSGASGLCAAIAAMDSGATTIVVEKLPITGGTTRKSGGGFWIPNNSLMRAQGRVDNREDCMRYMARYAFPQVYTPNSPTLGLPADRYRLLAAFYDNAAPMVDRYVALGALRVREFRMLDLDIPAPDHADHLPENKQPVGRGLESNVATGGLHQSGVGLVHSMESWLRERNVPFLMEHRVTSLMIENGRVIGLEATTGGKPVRLRARKGVVFGTGGFAHNLDLVDKHIVSLWGACAGVGSTGDFLDIAIQAGAAMGSLSTAWRSQVLFEEALENRAVAFGTFFLPGDSMVLVNKYGRRVVNEKRSYNDRTKAHFVYDPTREEYPNQLLFMVFDQRTLEAYAGSFPIPENRKESRFLIEGRDWNDLAVRLDARLKVMMDKSGGVRLAQNFGAELKKTLARYNDYAISGVDAEFERGRHTYDREWNKLFSRHRKESKYPPNRMPNPVMHPVADKGPYYAFILAAGALDTSGGPRINEKAQVLGARDKPIPGLYGAGNCIASPTGEAYYGSGGTLGPAMTFGYIAGKTAAQEQV